MGDIRNKLAKIQRSIDEKRAFNRFLGLPPDYKPSPPKTLVHRLTRQSGIEILP